MKRHTVVDRELGRRKSGVDKETKSRKKALDQGIRETFGGAKSRGKSRRARGTGLPHFD